MSFDTYKDVIEEGDTVIIYVNIHSMYALEVKPEKENKNGEITPNIFQTSYGALKVKELIGQRFGTKIQLSRGYAYALYPTPDLWTRTLPHRTQILYATDISLIILQLELKPGSVVVESGTGSGSLAHSLVRTIAPTGHLHTFDFHQKRVDLANEEFRIHKINEFVTAKQRDVCGEGFGSELNNRADAVFLDLPHPWDAIPHAKQVLKKSTGGRICSFSPCIEQVQKAISKMREEGFCEISTVECLMREFQARKITMPTFDVERKDPSLVEEISSNNVNDKNETTFLTGIPLITMPGHTGYLTFATLPPLIMSDINDQ